MRFLRGASLALTSSAKKLYASFGVVLMLLALAAAPLRADILHLASGTTVEGEIISQDAENYVVKTTAGTITLPADSVLRVEKAASPFQEYQVRAETAADTVADQIALADWCGERGLQAERRKHLQRALELDPDSAAARTSAGYVRVGDLWVDARTPAKRERPPRPAATEEASAAGEGVTGGDEKTVAEIQTTWIRRIRTIKMQQLDSSSDRAVRAGRQSILEIRDPLAILPLTRVLATGNRAARELLVEALSTFTEDEATMNLAAMALIDSQRSVRSMAVSELRKRDDPRVAPQFRRALRSDNDEMIRRAAFALGEIGDASAIPELIEALKVRRWKMVEVPVRRYFGDWYTVFNGQTVTTAGQVKLSHKPQLGFDTSGMVTVQPELQVRDVTVYRTEVLEALKSLTGENFGFEMAAWRRWYQEKKP